MNKTAKTRRIVAFLGRTTTVIMMVIIYWYFIKDIIMNLINQRSENPAITIFMGWMGFVIILNAVSFLLYDIIGKQVPLPLDKLGSGEKIIKKSSRNKIIWKAPLSFGTACPFITFTNKRIIISGNYFGYYTYKRAVRSVWYEKNNRDKTEKTALNHFAEKIEIDEIRKRLIFRFLNNRLEVQVDNPREIYDLIHDCQDS